MWRSLSSRLALRSALGLKHRSQAPETSGRIANAAVSLFEASLLVFAGFQISKSYRALREQEQEQEQESFTRDVAHLRLPVLVEYNLHRARLRIREDAGEDAFIYAAQAARHAAEAGILTDELLLALGEIFAAACARDARILHALASERFPDANAPEGWRVQTLDHVHRSVLALMLRDQAQDRPLPLRWLAVAALSAQPAQKPLAEKLLADSLDSDVDRAEERAGALPVLIDLDLPGIRHLQLAALHASVARWAEDTNVNTLSLATCCIKLAGGLVNDVRIRDAHLPGPRDATLLCARHLHSTALRLLPSETEARRNSSEEVRDAFGRMYFQRALMSLTTRDKQFFPNLDAALSWYAPGDRNYAALRELRDFAILRGVQLYREEHGKEFEIEL